MNLRDFKRSGHWPSLLSAFLYFDSSFALWTLIGALGVFITQTFHLSDTQKGLLVAVPLLGGSILRIILGVATDHFGPRKAGLAGMMLTFVPLIWGWRHSSSLSDMWGVGLLLGVAGASFAVALPLASQWYPARFQGLALGIAGAGNSGTVFSALFAPRLAEHFGWRAVFGLATLPLLIVLTLFALVAQDGPGKAAPKPLGNYLKLLKEPDCWRLSGFYMVTFGGFVGLASFLPIFFFDQYGVTKVQAGSFAALCVFAGSFLRPVGGYLADRVGGIKVLSFLYGAIGLMLFTLAALPSLFVALPLLFFTMACLGAGNGSVFQLVPQRFRKEIGVATGVIGASGGLGGFFVPTLMGSLKGMTGTFAAGLVLFALIAAYAMFAMLRVGPEWRTVWTRSDLEAAV
ncbi:MAG: NarK/NasA family nitrate transporter [Deltaproteobacteria bacterium]|nr:NarK/NasA family nitrate transporter [Deltaproteobacteria bacterium]